MHLAKVTGATRVVAKLNRLSRAVAFLAALKDSGVSFVAGDMPDTSELTIHIIAAAARAERKAISRRTKEALAAAKTQGVRLGNPNGAAALVRADEGNMALVEAINGADRFAADLVLIFDDITGAGFTSLRTVAAELTGTGLSPVAARHGGYGA